MKQRVLYRDDPDRLHRDELARAIRETPKPEGSRIDKIRYVVEHKTGSRIEGVLVDLFSASLITQIYDGLIDANKTKFAACSVPAMADLAYKLESKLRGR